MTLAAACYKSHEAPQDVTSQDTGSRVARILCCSGTVSHGPSYLQGDPSASGLAPPLSSDALLPTANDTSQQLFHTSTVCSTAIRH